MNVGPPHLKVPTTKISVEFPMKDAFNGGGGGGLVVS